MLHLTKIQQYLKNKKEISSNYNAESEIVKKLEEEKRDASWKWDDKIIRLKNKKYAEEGNFDKKIEMVKKLQEETRDKLNIVVNDLDKILWLLEKQGETKTAKFDLKNVRGRYSNSKPEEIELLETIEENKIKLGLYVAENNRPANKFNLVVVGYTPFTDGHGDKFAKGMKTFNLHSSCSVGFNTEGDAYDHRPNIEHDLKFFKSKAQAKHYAQQGLRKIFSKTMNEYEQVKLEFEDAIKNYKLEDFAKIREQRSLSYSVYHCSVVDDGDIKNFLEEMKTIRPITEQEATKIVLEERIRQR